MDGKKQPVVIRVVRKKKGGGGHHGGSWKVAYADFVTAMMAFFLVMWIMGMDDSVKDMVQGYFNNPIGFRKAMSGGQNFTSIANSPLNMNVERIMLVARETQRREFELVRADILDAIEGRTDLAGFADQVEMVVTDEGLRIELQEDTQGETFFPFGSAELQPTALELLRALGPELDALDNGLILEGHTDAVPFGRSDRTNWELSTERAHAARRAILAGGYRATKVLEVRGYADRSLRYPDTPQDPRNRRISLLLPFRIDMLPVIEAGRRPDEIAAGPVPATPLDPIATEE